MTTTRGQSAYELRQTTGKPWDAVAEGVGCKTGDAAVAGAKKYARRNGLPWPLRSSKHVAAEQERFQAAQLRAEADASIYQRVQSGWPVSQIEDSTPSVVYKAIARHCGRTGDPMLAKNPERAYRMREAGGRTWREIAEALGFKRANNIIERARVFAQANDLPWPIEVLDRPGWSAERYIGKPFYDDATDGLDWSAVAKKHGRAPSYVVERAEVYAKAQNHPWPI